MLAKSLLALFAYLCVRIGRDIFCALYAYRRYEYYVVIYEMKAAKLQEEIVCV